MSNMSGMQKSAANKLLQKKKYTYAHERVKVLVRRKWKEKQSKSHKREEITMRVRKMVTKWRRRG